MSADSRLTPDEVASRQEVLIDSNRLISHRIAAGFHALLTESEDLYRRDYELAMNDLLLREHPGDARASLVEPRIPLEDQLEKLGAVVDPAILRFPRHNRYRQPYGAWIGIVRNPMCLSPRELIRSIPADVRLADAYEAAGTDIRGLTRAGFSFVAGDGESAGPRLCFDAWKGLPRLTRVAYNIADSATGLLVKYI